MIEPCDFVASPDGAKFGIVLLRYHLSGNLEILWEGHSVPYECLASSASRVEPDTVPISVRLKLQRDLKCILTHAAQGAA